MKKCAHLLAPAAPGDYVLRTTVNGRVTVIGNHSVNGVIVQSWTQPQLVPETEPFTVKVGENHSVQVVATFAPGAGAADNAKVELMLGGATVATCDLTPDGNTVSSMLMAA